MPSVRLQVATQVFFGANDMEGGSYNPFHIYLSISKPVGACNWLQEGGGCLADTFM
jgi:hypothetical protein